MRSRVDPGQIEGGEVSYIAQVVVVNLQLLRNHRGLESLKNVRTSSHSIHIARYNLDAFDCCRGKL